MGYNVTSVAVDDISSWPSKIDLTVNDTPVSCFHDDKDMTQWKVKTREGVMFGVNVLESANGPTHIVYKNRLFTLLEMISLATQERNTKRRDESLEDFLLRVFKKIQYIGNKEYFILGTQTLAEAINTAIVCSCGNA